MIYTWREGYSATPVKDGTLVILVDYDLQFARSDAVHYLNLSKSDDIGFLTRNWWWHARHRQFGMLLDFLTYRGAEITHLVGGFQALHTSYFSGAGGRMEKLYDPETLDIWAEFD